MTEIPAVPALTCVVCGARKQIQHSLSLSKDSKGNWTINPVCLTCRKSLLTDARSAGKFIPLFGIEASKKEAAKRNERAAFNRPFLEKFGRALRNELKPPKVALPKLRVVKERTR